MRIFMILMTSMSLVVSVFAQGDDTVQKPFRERFFLELNYSYLDVDLQLLSMTKHSVWDGQDFGTTELEQDEIDTLNAFVDYKDRFHGVNLAAGMVLLNKPGKHWYIDGKLMIGLAKKKYTVINTENHSTDITINSENFTPWYGLGFNFRYQFNPKWGLSLSPHTLYSYGTTDEIDDNLYPVVEFMDESRENRFNMSYTWINILASYTIKKFTVAAGPGFYLLYNTHKYNILRYNPSNGKTYEDVIETSLQAKSFVNGSLRLDWRFSNHLLLNAGACINNDIAVTAGITYFL